MALLWSTLNYSSLFRQLQLTLRISREYLSGNILLIKDMSFAAFFYNRE